MIDSFRRSDTAEHFNPSGLAYGRLDPGVILFGKMHFPDGTVSDKVRYYIVEEVTRKHEIWVYDITSVRMYEEHGRMMIDQAHLDKKMQYPGSFYLPKQYSGPFSRPSVIKCASLRRVTPEEMYDLDIAFWGNGLSNRTIQILRQKTVEGLINNEWENVEGWELPHIIYEMKRREERRIERDSREL